MDTRASSAASTSVDQADDVLVNNPYEILNVDVTASKRAVRDAFRRAAKTAHPDRGGTAEAFDALTKAADVLTDDAKRAQLDAKLLDVPAGSLTLEELRWSRELAALQEAEDAGEVKGPDAVLDAARAYAAAEKALDAIAKRKKKQEDADKLEKKTARARRLAGDPTGDHVTHRHERPAGKGRGGDDDGDA